MYSTTKFDIALESAYLACDKAMMECEVLANYADNNYNINRRSAALRCMEEGASYDTFYALEAENGQGWFTKIKDGLIKMCKNVWNFILTCVEKVKGLFQSKKNTRGLADIEQSVKQNPAVRKSKVRFTDANNKVLQQADSVLAKFQAKLGAGKDLSPGEMTHMQQAIQVIRDHPVASEAILASAVVTAVAVPTAITMVKKKINVFKQLGDATKKLGALIQSGADKIKNSKFVTSATEKIMSQKWAQAIRGRIESLKKQTKSVAVTVSDNVTNIKDASKQNWKDPNTIGNGTGYDDFDEYNSDLRNSMMLSSADDTIYSSTYNNYMESYDDFDDYNDDYNFDDDTYQW